MSEEKNKQNRKEKDGCPLCNVSEETLKRLKESGGKKTDNKSVENNKRSKDKQ